MSRRNLGKLFYEMRRRAIYDAESASSTLNVVRDGHGQCDADQEAEKDYEEKLAHLTSGATSLSPPPRLVAFP